MSFSLLPVDDPHSNDVGLDPEDFEDHDILFDHNDAFPDANDYYGDDDDGFENYIPQTTDPGPWMLIAATLYSLCCIIILPFLITWSNQRNKRRGERKAPSEILDLVNVSIIETVNGVHIKDVTESNEDPKQGEGFKDEASEDLEMTSIYGGKNALCSCRTFKRAYHELGVIATPDKETRRIFGLGAPFVLASIVDSAFEALCVALISKYLGIEALQAYVITNLLIGLSDVLVGGFLDALDTVCPHAIGAGNHKLAGQYVQISTIIYAIGSLPIMGMWLWIMEDCLRLFGMSDDVVEIGVQYTKVVIFDYLLSGLFDSFTGLLDVIGYVKEGTAFDIVAGAADAVVLWVILETVPGITLYWVGVIHLISCIVTSILFTSIAVFRGWLDPFWEGLVGSNALKNISAVKYVVRTAIPLSLGSLLEYGEWETLTVFAAFLGPAEVAAWGLIESIWALFESATEGLSEAGSMRLAYHLGKGNVEQAPMSAWKSLFMSTIMAIFESIVFLSWGKPLATWFTDDPILQEMMISMVPLVAIGNILMVFGMVSWSLVGAQNRYRLATTVSALMSFFVTLPLAAIFCIAYKFTLEGLVAAVVIGYSTTGLIFAYILLKSDWKQISKAIREENEESLSDESESSSSAGSTDEEGSEDHLKKSLHQVPVENANTKTMTDMELVNPKHADLPRRVRSNNTEKTGDSMSLPDTVSDSTPEDDIALVNPRIATLPRVTRSNSTKHSDVTRNVLANYDATALLDTCLDGVLDGSCQDAKLVELKTSNLPRVILMGPRGAGKTSIQSVVFQKMSPQETESRLAPTQKLENLVVDHTDKCEFTVWDSPGDCNDVSDLEGLDDIILGSTSLVFVMDAQDKPYDRVLQSFKDNVTRAIELNPSINVEMFINKVDEKLFPSDEAKYNCRREVVTAVTDMLQSTDPEGIHIRYHLTSIYDYSIHRALSDVVQRLVTELPALENLLNVLVRTCSMEKAYLFDVATKLYISTDSSPVDMKILELCPDIIDAAFDEIGSEETAATILSTENPCVQTGATELLCQGEHVTSAGDDSAPKTENGTEYFDSLINEICGGCENDHVGDAIDTSDSHRSSVVQLSDGIVLYMKEVGTMLALICITKSENFKKESLIDPNIDYLKNALNAFGRRADV